MHVGPALATVSVKARGVPGRTDPSLGSMVMSARLRRSSTKYGPSVSAGVTMHAGVATATPEELAVAVEDAEGLEVDRPTPEQAAAKEADATANPATIMRRREMVAASTASSMLILGLSIAIHTGNPLSRPVLAPGANLAVCADSCSVSSSWSP